MDWAGWATFGFAATVVLTAIVVAAQMLGFTRMDLPLMLGTIVSKDLDRARVIGLFMHLVNGQFFAVFYMAAFSLMDQSSWWLGGIFGAIHGAAALTLIVPLLPGIHPRMSSQSGGPDIDNVLEPPGLFGLNYGRETAIVMLLAHVVFGAILGTFLRAT
jgi:hypothetical protein